MLRLIHNQTVPGPLLVDDIDDGLPNKEVHRLGSTADPKAYKRDGYANATKQGCYVPHNNLTNVGLPGYVDLRQTDRVTLSAGSGKIQKMKTVGLLTVVSFVATDVAAPTVSIADLGTPSTGAVTITGTNLTSLQPNQTLVTFTGTGAITLTQAQILAGSGTISNTSILIPAALIPGVALTTSFASVTADLQSTAPVALT